MSMHESRIIFGVPRSYQKGSCQISEEQILSEFKTLF